MILLLLVLVLRGLVYSACFAVVYLFRLWSSLLSCVAYRIVFVLSRGDLLGDSNSVTLLRVDSDMISDS